MMRSVTHFLSTGQCLWCAQWQVSWALDSVCDALSDKFPEHWMVFVVHWVTSFLIIGWCLWCTQWQVSWALDGVCGALSDKSPDNWMVSVMLSVTSFLSTGRYLWCTQWQFSWTLDSGHLCRYWCLGGWSQLHESFQTEIFWIKFYLPMCCPICLMTVRKYRHLKSLECLHACFYFPFYCTNKQISVCIIYNSTWCNFNNNNGAFN